MTTKLLLFVKRSEDINRGMLACLPGAIKQYATGFGWPQTVASDSSRLCRSLLENEWATWLLTNCSFLKEWKRLFLCIRVAPSGGFVTVLPPCLTLEHKELFKVLYSNLTLFNSASVISETVEIFMETEGQRLAGCFPVHSFEIQSCICLQQVKNLQANL